MPDELSPATSSASADGTGAEQPAGGTPLEFAAQTPWLRRGALEIGVALSSGQMTQTAQSGSRTESSCSLLLATIIFEYSGSSSAVEAKLTMQRRPFPRQ